MANHTPVRHVRVPRRRWFLAGLITKRRDEDRSKIINEALEKYNKRNATPEELALALAEFPDQDTDQ